MRAATSRVGVVVHEHRREDSPLFYNWDESPWLLSFLFGVNIAGATFVMGPSAS